LTHEQRRVGKLVLTLIVLSRYTSLNHRREALL
jgi:hypothetical protein